MDIDNLQGVCIWLVKQINEEHLLIDCMIIYEFTSSRQKSSVHMGFVNLLKASMDFFMELSKAKD